MIKSNNRERVRVPAPILTMIYIVLAMLLGRLVPLPIPAPAFVQWLGLGVVVLGFIFGVMALVEFRRFRKLDPKIRGKGFVTTGIYKHTRNPIYLGFVLMLIGFPLNVGSYWGVLLAWPMIVVMNSLIIKPEETFLEGKFKDEYNDYRSRVKRWL